MASFRCFVALQENLYSLSAMPIITGMPNPPYLGGRAIMFLSSSVQLNSLLMIAGINSSRVTCSRGVSLSATPGVVLHT